MSRAERRRSALSFVLVALAVVGTGVAAAPWLRVYPSGVLAVPLFGAAALSVLTPVVAVGIGLRRLWLTALVDLVVYLFFTTLVGLHDPVGVTRLWDGLVHGPSAILTFALPLVSPRTLLVVPMTLCWLAGTVVGECVARSWHAVLPYATLVVAFVLSYAGSLRGVSTVAAGRRYDVVLAAALLVTLLVTRAVEGWIEHDLDSDASQSGGRLPLRGLGAGVMTAVVVAVLAALTVQASAFSGPPVTPDRRPPVERGTPLSPVSFVAGLRPRDLASAGVPVFSVRVNRPTGDYIALADVDDYDGEGWTFDRTFRPSGGVIPGDTDPALRSSAAPVTQQYTIDAGALTDAPWMPFLYRPRQVSGVAVDVDSSSGMIVPTAMLRAGERFSVTSDATGAAFESLPASALPATSAGPADTFVDGDVASSLGPVLTSFEDETKTRDSDPIAFLQALVRDLHANYALAGARGTSTDLSAAVSSGSTDDGTGGTGFATVLASVLGPSRAATPEQYATLVALVARQLGVPARLVSGFRVGGRGGTLRPGRTYRATTAQAWTWVEIPVQGRGWVVLDPAPSRAGAAPRNKQSAPARPTSRPTPTVTPNGLATQSAGGHAVAPKSKVPSGSRASAGSVLVIVLLAVALGLLLTVLVLWGRKWLRVRRRRRVGDPRERLLGAWREGIDVLVESGLPDPAAFTSAELANATADHFGAESADQVRFIGERANAAIFSPTSWIDSGDADAAWHAHAVLRRTLRRQLTVGQRVGARVRYRRVRRVH